MRHEFSQQADRHARQIEALRKDQADRFGELTDKLENPVLRSN